MRFDIKNPLDYYNWLMSDAACIPDRDIESIDGSVSVWNGIFHDNYQGPAWMLAKVAVNNHKTSSSENVFYYFDTKTNMQMNLRYTFDISGREMSYEDWEKYPLVRETRLNALISEVLDEA